MAELPKPGDTFESRYRLREIAGRGGQATVYRAEDNETGTAVAIKILHPTKSGYERTAVARFERELRLARQLRSEHAVRVFGGGQSSTGLLYLVGEFVHGKSLAAILEDGPLPEARAAVILRQLMLALSEAHARGLVHRDIKPENVMVAQGTDGQPLAKLLDFGIAREQGAGAGVTQTGELVGTPRYMAPEQLRAQPLTAASDLYSLGVVAIEMLYGRDALHGSGLLDQLDRLHSGYVVAAPMLEQTSPRLREVIGTLTRVRPEDRYPTAAHAIAALDGVSEPSGPARVAPPLVVAHPPAGVSAAAKIAVLGFVAVGLAVLALVVLPDRTSAPAVSRLSGPNRGALLARTPDDGVVMQDAASDGSAMDGGAAQPDTREFLTTSAGCGKSPPGHGPGHYWNARPGWPSAAYLPAGYQEDVPHGALLIFHQQRESAQEVLRDDNMREFADREHVVLLAPRDVNKHGSWWDEKKVVEEARVEIEAAANLVCLDRTRVYAMGNGAGSKAVEFLDCEYPLTAIATHGYRADSASCRSRTPYIHIGGSAKENRFPPLAFMDEYWDWHGCAGEPSVESEPEGECEIYPCQSGLVACWTASPAWPIPDERARNIPQPGFQIATRIADFFAAQAPLRPDQLRPEVMFPLPPEHVADE